MTCRPYAAQPVVTGGLRAHTRKMTVPEVEPALRLAPQSVPLGGSSSV